LQKGCISARITLMQKVENNKKDTKVSIEEMFSAGAHYGYGKTRRHPSLSSFIYTTKNKGDIIDLEKTSIQLSAAKEFVKSLGARNKVLLFVGTKPEAKEIIKNVAEALNMPYVNERWIGGTLSNFTEIKKRINELENYRKENKEGGLEKYTKKERVVMAKKMEKLARYYSGLIGLKKLPDTLYIVDAKAESIAQTESLKSNVPVVALLNSDSNIKNIDYPIVCNDAGIPSIKLFTETISDSYKEGQMSIPSIVTDKSALIK
jgi:small subunit ribosomal protein S2